MIIGLLKVGCVYGDEGEPRSDLNFCMSDRDRRKSKYIL